MSSVLERLSGQLIVSVQADEGSPLRHTAHILALCRAALVGGAGGLRLRSASDIAAVRAITDVPISGLTKQRHPGSPVYITATPGEAREVAAAGADVVAFDATDSPRPFSVAELVAAIHAAGALALADLSTLEEARAAYSAGADIVSTTMSGYTPHSPRQETPDFELMVQLRAAGLAFVAEGRLNTPELAALARQLGAHAVVVGSAITRPDVVTGWFLDALQAERRER